MNTSSKEITSTLRIEIVIKLTDEELLFDQIDSTLEFVLIDPTELNEAKVEFFVRPLFNAPDNPFFDPLDADWSLSITLLLNFVSNFEESNFELEFEFVFRGTGFDGQSDGSNVSLKIF